jgi:quercetin dioxygenase-like cupin family protein
MTDDAFAQFEQEYKARGFDQCLVRQWQPAQSTEVHTHPFDVEAMVQQGEFWLTVGGATQHLKEGDRFALGRDIEHSERYGDHGATVWVARRTG